MRAERLASVLTTKSAVAVIMQSLYDYITTVSLYNHIVISHAERYMFHHGIECILAS